MARASAPTRSCLSHALLSLLREHAPRDGALFWRLVCREWAAFDVIPHQDYEAIFRRFRAEWRPDFMEGGSRALYDSLPRAFVAYRGQPASAPVGLSWTLDRGVAEEFARGHRGTRNPSPVVLVARIDKRNVAFACADRFEAEVVVFRAPRRLHVEPLGNAA